MLEGGYNVPILAGSVVAHLAGLGLNQAELARTRSEMERCIAACSHAKRNDPDGI